jgi:hypothetical protein
MSQHLTPKRLLELAGLPVTKLSLKKLTEAKKPVKEAIGGQPPIIVYGHDGDELWAVTGYPPELTAENWDHSVDKYLSPEEQEISLSIDYSMYPDAVPQEEIGEAIKYAGKPRRISFKRFMDDWKYYIEQHGEGGDGDY